MDSVCMELGVVAGGHFHNFQDHYPTSDFPREPMGSSHFLLATSLAPQLRHTHLPERLWPAEPAAQNQMLLNNGIQDSLTWRSQTNAIHEFRLDLKSRVDRKKKKAPRTAWYIWEPITEQMCSQVDQDWGKWNNQVSDNQRSHDYLHVAISTVLQSEKVQKDGSAVMPQRPCTHLHSPGGRTAADLSWRNTLCPSRDMRGGGLRSAWSLP